MVTQELQVEPEVVTATAVKFLRQPQQHPIPSKDIIMNDATRERIVATIPAALKRQVEQSAKDNRRSVAREIQVALEQRVATARREEILSK